MMLLYITVAKRETLPDPLLAYADILPGQPRNALAARGLACVVPNYPVGESCSFQLESGPFSQVHAVIVNDHIEALNLIAYESTLTVGDLVLWWGRPDVVLTGRHTTLAWHIGAVIAVANLNPHRQFDYFSVVPQFTLIRGETTGLTPLPD
jgi:hypothetical protein